MQVKNKRLCYAQTFVFNASYNEQAVLRSRTIASDSLQLVSVCRRKQAAVLCAGICFLTEPKARDAS